MIKHKLENPFSFESEFYINYSKKKEKQSQNFVRNKFLYNTTNPNNEFYKIEYDLKKKLKNDYIWIVQNSIDIQEESIKIGLDKCMFLTMTLDKEYHKYKKINGAYVSNPQFDTSKTIEVGYRLLNDTMLKIRKQLTRDSIPFRFVKVIEPFKQLSCHMHCLIYVPDDYYEELEKIVKNKSNKDTTKELRSLSIEKKNPKTCKRFKGTNGIGRIELETIVDVKRGSAYLLKYLKKTTNVDTMNKNEMYFYDGWKRYNKIRILTFSQSKLPRYVFNKVAHFVDDEIKKNQNMLTYVKSNCELTVMKNIEKFNSEVLNNDNINEDDYIDYRIINSNAIFKIEVYKEDKNIKSLIKDFTKVNYFLECSLLQGVNFVKEMMNHFDDVSSILCDFVNYYIIEDSNEFIDTNDLNLLYEYLYDFENVEERFRVYLAHLIYEDKTILAISNIVIKKNDILVYNKSDFELVESVEDEVECNLN